MRFMVPLILLASALPLAAAAQTPEAAPAAPAAPAAATYSADSELGVLLDNAATKAVLNKYVPELINNDQIAQARAIPLRALQQYVGDMLTDEKLAQIDADLAKVPAK